MKDFKGEKFEVAIESGKVSDCN